MSQLPLARVGLVLQGSLKSEYIAFFSLCREEQALPERTEVGEWLLGGQATILSSAWNTVREEGSSLVSSAFIATISGDQKQLLLETGVMLLAYC